MGMDGSKKMTNVEKAMGSFIFRSMPMMLPDPSIYSVSDIEDCIENLFHYESDRRERVDNLASHVSKTGQFPANVCFGDGYLLYLRMSAALDFLGKVYPPVASRSPFDHDFEDWEEVELFEWLIVDLWHRHADSFLKLVALECSSRFPFYGLEDADPDLEE